MILIYIYTIIAFIQLFFSNLRLNLEKQKKPREGGFILIIMALPKSIIIVIITTFNYYFTLRKNKKNVKFE